MKNKRRSGEHKHNIIAGRIAAVVAACSFVFVTGCGSSDKPVKIVFTTGFAKDEVFRIEDTVCTLKEAKAYLLNTREGYEASFGEGIWNCEAGNETVEDRLKDSVLAKIAQIKTMDILAAEKGIVLDDKENQKAEEDGRTETKLIDTFFLGTSIWGRSASNTAISESYRKILMTQLYKNSPSLLEKPYDADDLLMRVNHLVNSSNNLYETKPFNGEKCLSYRITVAGESVPIYVPLKYIETDLDFNPYNELRQIEKRVLCNYHGTSNCTISIDPQVRARGLRSSVNQASNSNTPVKFEEFGSLPTYILMENAPEIIDQKKADSIVLTEEIKVSLERETANLVALRNIYKQFNESKDDLFCFTQMFNSVQEAIKTQFDSTANTIKTIKKASETITAFSNMFKTPSPVGKPQVRQPPR